MLKAMEGQGGGPRSVRMTRKAEIDTSPPFRSVKEAVMMFGDTVLAGELYATKLKQMNGFGSGKNDGGVPMELGRNVTAELEETKQNLEKAQEESLIMATCLSSLQDELERTKKELRQLKAEQKKSEQAAPPAEPEEEEDLKSIEVVSTEFELKSAAATTKPENSNNNNNVEFQKKKYVTFANPPSVVARVMVPESDDARLERMPSMKKKKNRSSIPLIGGLLSRMKGATAARG